MTPEYSVHDESDFARVYDEDDELTVRRGDLRALLDLATGSMDFGSGFWDNEQAEIARNAARLLDINPDDVTPVSLICSYRGHRFKRVEQWQRDFDVRFGYDKNPNVRYPEFQCIDCHQSGEELPEGETEWLGDDA